MFGPIPRTQVAANYLLVDALDRRAPFSINIKNLSKV